MTTTGHDPHDPLSEINMLEASLLAVRLPPCRHCSSQHDPMPMSGSGWGVQITHQPGCPDHDDALPEPTRPGEEQS